MSLSGIITTVAGIGTSGFSGDGFSATSAKISAPTAVVVDTVGNIYIDDWSNMRIRKIDMVTGIISTIAGNGTGAFWGEGVPATSAEIWGVEDMCLDRMGNLYLADHYNYRIRKIDTKGIISTVAGNGVMSSTGTGDGGPATMATFNMLYGLAVDDTGNLYISDYNAGKVRRVDVYGIITTIAGSGSTTYIGDGIPATSANIAPGRLTFDISGNLTIADRYNRRVFQVDHSGIIHSIVGNSMTGYSGDGGLATAASTDYPAGVTYDACGNLYISESTNKRVRKVKYPPTFTTPVISLSGITVAPAGATVMVTATVAKTGSSYIIHWMNHGTEFTTTTIPSVTYTKGPGTDTITARVVSTAVYGCYDSTTSNEHIVSSGSLGLALSAQPGLSVYPNPSNDILHIDGLQHAAIYRLQNMVGAVMQEGILESGNNAVSVKGLPSGGLYLLEIKDSEGSRSVCKFLKE